MNLSTLAPPGWWLAVGTLAGLFDAWLVFRTLQMAAAVGCPA